MLNNEMKNVSINVVYKNIRDGDTFKATSEGKHLGFP